MAPRVGLPPYLRTRLLGTIRSRLVPRLIGGHGEPKRFSSTTRNKKIRNRLGLLIFLLGGWDDFRTADWYKIVKYPEIVMQQASNLLALPYLTKYPSNIKLQRKPLFSAFDNHNSFHCSIFSN